MRSDDRMVPWFAKRGRRALPFIGLAVLFTGAAKAFIAVNHPAGAGAGEIAGVAGTTNAEVQIVVGSAALAPDGEGTIDVQLLTSTGGVVATLNDIQFEAPISVSEVMMTGTTLAAGIDADEDMIAVADATRLPDLGSVRIGDELILYAAKLGDVLVVAARGADGTTASTHEAGTPVEVPTRLPGCEMAPAVAALGKSAVFSFLPSGCTPGGGSAVACRGVRAIVLGVSTFAEIPNGTILYTCEIAAGAQPGDYPLTCPEGGEVALPYQPAQASGDPDAGQPAARETICEDGGVAVLVEPSATPTAVGPTTTPTFAEATPTATATATSATPAEATATPTEAIATPTETVATPTATEDPTPTLPPPACAGDCDGNEVVSIDELILGVNIGLARVELEECEPLDANGSGSVTVDELVRAAKDAIDGCP